VIEFRTPVENVERGIHPDRLRAFDKGALSMSEMVLLIQDIVEANVIDRLDPIWIMRAAYYTQLGWVHPGAGLGVNPRRLN